MLLTRGQGSSMGGIAMTRSPNWGEGGTVALGKHTQLDCWRNCSLVLVR